MALDDIRDVRQRAAAILSGRKLQELERHGLAVIERSELERYRKVEAAAKEIFGNFQMGRPNYWELYKDPPEEFLRLHDALYTEAGNGREWALVDKRRLEGLERVAEIARHLYSHHYVEYNDETTWQELWDALEAMERETPAG